jgi:hypothetical protein
MCPGWPPMAQTSVLLISASQVARITCMSHQPPARQKLDIWIQEVWYWRISDDVNNWLCFVIILKKSHQVIDSRVPSSLLYLWDGWEMPRWLGDKQLPESPWGCWLWNLVALQWDVELGERGRDNWLSEASHWDTDRWN